MPLFDLGDSVRIQRKFPCSLEQAVERCRTVLDTYSDMGFKVELAGDSADNELGAKVKDSSGTNLDVVITLDDDGANTALELSLQGTVHVGGAKGMFASEKMVRQVASQQLSSFVDKQFQGIRRPAARSTASATSDPLPEPEPQPHPVPEPEPESEPERPEPARPERARPERAPGYAELADSVEAEDYETTADQDQAVLDAITVCSVGSAAVTVQPFPLVDIALITPIQMAMVQMIGSIRGYKLTPQSITELIGTFGASMVSRNLVIAVAKLIPVAGWAVSVPVAYALTYAMGKSVDMYFQSGRTVPLSEVKQMFDSVYESTKREKEQSAKGNASLKDKLAQLVEAFDAGLISQQEFTDKKEELLTAL